MRTNGFRHSLLAIALGCGVLAGCGGGGGSGKEAPPPAGPPPSITPPAPPAGAPNGHLVAGALASDDAVIAYDIEASASGTELRITSLGFAGATHSSGQVIPGGGMAAVLALFDAQGRLLQLAAGGSFLCTGSTPRQDPQSHACWDPALSFALQPNVKYRLMVSQDGNPPLGPDLDAGYPLRGEPNFTGLQQLGAAAAFIAPGGQRRTGQFTLEIGPTSVHVTPRPAP